MNKSLPEAISYYYQMSNNEDYTLLSLSFLNDAHVQDEGHTYKGLDSILDWLKQSKQKYQYTVEAVDIRQQNNIFTVITAVSGNFPGSPVQLENCFELTEDKIQSLRIQ